MDSFQLLNHLAELVQSQFLNLPNTLTSHATLFAHFLQRAVPGDRVTVDGAITHYNSAGWVTFWGLEWMRSDTNRISSQSGFNPTDITKHQGFDTFVPNVRLINMVIHDQVGSAVYMSPDATGADIYGCLLYNNGYATADLADGHALYIKNDGATKTLADNVAINGFAVGLHVYTEDADALNNLLIEGNVAFNGGIYT